jgi:hypothetical protein
MRSPTYYRIRGLVRLAFALLLLAGLYLIATNIWWDGTGFCVGSIERCGL